MTTLEDGLLRVTILLTALMCLCLATWSEAGDVGGCCLCDGSCIVVTEEECDAEPDGGNFNGLGTVCDPNPCAQPLPSACCLPDGSCLDLGACQVRCEELGGVFFYQQDCREVDCTPTPIEEKTWGLIKAVYR